MHEWVILLTIVALLFAINWHNQPARPDGAEQRVGEPSSPSKPLPDTGMQKNTLLSETTLNDWRGVERGVKQRFQYEH